MQFDKNDRWLDDLVREDLIETIEKKNLNPNWYLLDITSCES